MEETKTFFQFRFHIYNIELTVFAEQQLSLRVIDTEERVQYFDKEIFLKIIGVSTLIKAFEKSKNQIKIDIEKKTLAKNRFLEMKVTVESLFLKSIEETILLQNMRELSEADTFKKTLDCLSRKVQELKDSNNKNKIKTYYSATLKQKTYNSGRSYESIGDIELPKGKYLITFNFLCQIGSGGMYLHFNQGQNLMQSSGFYSPNQSHFIPYTVRKIHKVTKQTEKVSFTTNLSQTYPIFIRNAIITAKVLPQ